MTFTWKRAIPSSFYFFLWASHVRVFCVTEICLILIIPISPISATCTQEENLNIEKNQSFVAHWNMWDAGTINYTETCDSLTTTTTHTHLLLKLIHPAATALPLSAWQTAKECLIQVTGSSLGSQHPMAGGCRIQKHVHSFMYEGHHSSNAPCCNHTEIFRCLSSG